MDPAAMDLSWLLGGGPQPIDPNMGIPISQQPPPVVPPPVVPPVAPQLSTDPNAGIPISGPPSLGQSLNGANAGAPNVANNVMNALRTVQAPKPPEAQKVGTPAAPHATKAIKGGALLDQVAAMGITPAQAMAKYQLPATLMAALGGR